MDTGTLVILILGIWGSFLSTVLGILKIMEYKKSIKVTTKLGFAERYGLVRGTLTIGGVNKGKRPLKIKSYGLLLPHDKVMYPLDPIRIDSELPVILEDGDSVSVILDVVEISKSLIREGFKGTIEVRGFLSSPSKKKRIMSKPINVDTDYWLKKSKE